VQTQAPYKAAVEGLATSLYLRLKDVFIYLVEVKRESWSFDNGVAHAC
jgi:hypothetical protein